MNTPSENQIACTSELNRASDPGPETVAPGLTSKKPIDPVSGNGVPVRDWDGLMTFATDEEQGALVLELSLLRLPPVKRLVVKWNWPLLARTTAAEPVRLQRNGYRPRFT